MGSLEQDLKWGVFHFLFHLLFLEVSILGSLGVSQEHALGILLLFLRLQIQSQMNHHLVLLQEKEMALVRLLQGLLQKEQHLTMMGGVAQENRLEFKNPDLNLKEGVVLQLILEGGRLPETHQLEIKDLRLSLKVVLAQLNHLKLLILKLSLLEGEAPNLNREVKKSLNLSQEVELVLDLNQLKGEHRALKVRATLDLDLREVRLLSSSLREVKLLNLDLKEEKSYHLMMNCLKVLVLEELMGLFENNLQQALLNKFHHTILLLKF